MLNPLKLFSYQNFEGNDVKNSVKYEEISFWIYLISITTFYLTGNFYSFLATLVGYLGMVLTVIYYGFHKKVMGAVGTRLTGAQSLKGEKDFAVAKLEIAALILLLLVLILVTYFKFS